MSRSSEYEQGVNDTVKVIDDYLKSKQKAWWYWTNILCFVKKAAEKLVTQHKPGEVYVVMGYSDTNQNGSEVATLMGVFSSADSAKECGKELEESGVVDRYEIEVPLLDEFGYK